MGPKRRRLAECKWRCEMCTAAAAEPSTRRPGPLGPTSLCAPCATLSLRAAKLARRCQAAPEPRSAAAAQAEPAAPPRQPRRVSTRTQASFHRRWCLVTSVIEDAAVEALMRRHTWQPDGVRQGDGEPAAQNVDLAWVEQQAAAGWVAPITVRSAGPKGNGAYAARPLCALEPIGEYAGVVLTSTLMQRSGTFSEYTFELRCCGLVVDSEERGNLTRFINHAPAPHSNVFAMVVIVGGLRKIALRALREVQPDEELLLDYGYEREDWMT